MPPARVVLANDPPAGVRAAGGHCFAVAGGAVLVRPAGPGDEAGLYLGTLDGAGCWAVDAPDAGDGFVPLRALHGTVDDLVWTLAGRAVQLVEWARTTRFCGRCAGPTEPVPAERARRCPACGLHAFPRLAPAVIVLVERDGRVLLARNHRFPGRLFGCLAGFVEPGETLEETVHREVAEEVGIELADVRYFGSQPWPFPHSLMVGFTARWAGGDVVCDGTEIAEAGWFGPDDLPAIPPPLSIARSLIDAWLARSR